MIEMRTGIISAVISPTEFDLDCSCWLCFEVGTIHFKKPCGLALKKGDMVIVVGQEYNWRRIYGSIYLYVWDMYADSVALTTREEEIKRLEVAGETKCGWYDTLTDIDIFEDIFGGLIKQGVLV